MKPPFFDLLIAGSLEEALDCLHERGSEARIIAGGQSLMPMLNMRLVSPKILLDISRIAELAYVRERDGFIEVGAATTQAELLAWPGLARKAPLLAMTIPHIGHFQTRNRGTVCGSLSHADPSSELPLALAALGGEVELRSRSRLRRLKASEFQTGMLSTAREEDEILVAARFPVASAGASFAFDEIARRHGDFAIVSLATVVERGATRLAVGGIAERPAVRSFDGLEGEALDDALNEFAWKLCASDDIHASARYRREMVRRMGRKLIGDARDAL